MMIYGNYSIASTTLMGFNGRMQCFSMQVMINNCFLLNPENNFAQIRFVVFENNAEIHTLIPKNDVTEPKVRRPGYSNNQLKSY